MLHSICMHHDILQCTSDNERIYSTVSLTIDDGSPLLYKDTRLTKRGFNLLRVWLLTELVYCIRLTVFDYLVQLFSQLFHV